MIVVCPIGYFEVWERWISIIGGAGTAFLRTQWHVQFTTGCASAPAFNPLKDTLKSQSNGPLYSNTVIGTLAVDGWAVTFLYQM